MYGCIRMSMFDCFTYKLKHLRAILNANCNKRIVNSATVITDKFIDISADDAKSMLITRVRSTVSY